MNDLPKIRVRVDETGRGEFWVDDMQLHAVVAARIDIQPGQDFTACTLTILAGDLDLELLSLGERVNVVIDTPPAVLKELVENYPELFSGMLGDEEE